LLVAWRKSEEIFFGPIMDRLKVYIGLIGLACRPKQQGGLGIRPLCHMNDTLTIKWIWRFAKEEDALWKKVITSKYVVDNLGWWSKKSSYTQGWVVGNPS